MPKIGKMAVRLVGRIRRKKTSRTKFEQEHLQPARRKKFWEVDSGNSTKIYGLRVLGKICSKHRIPVLPYKTYFKAEDFSLSEFLRQFPKAKRLLVRSDPISGNIIHQYEWMICPRKTFSLSRMEERLLEQAIREFMKDSSEKEKGYGRRFIVHPLKKFSDYLLVGSIEIGQHTGSKIFVKIRNQKKDPRVFRSSNIEHSGFFDSNFKFVTENGSEEKRVPKKLKKRLFQVGRELLRLKGKIPDREIEASFVTYNDSPDVPEFYDLRFIIV